MTESTIITQWGASFLKGTWRYIRQTFSGAGQDSFTQPPSQNEDQLMQGLNVLPPLDGGFRPRWGYQLFNTGAMLANSGSQSTPPFLYQSDLLNFRQYVLPQPTQVPVVSEGGVTVLASLFTPTAQPRMVNSRSYGYFASGQLADQVKWDGSTIPTITKWGILAPVGGAAGPNTALTGADGGGAGGGVHGPWGNPTAVTGSGLFATNTVPGGSGHVLEKSTQLEATNFNFSLSALDTIAGITITANVKQTNTNAAQPVALNARLIKNGVVQTTGSRQVLVPSGTTAAVVTFGGSADLWGASYAATDVNLTNWGVAFSFVNGASPAGTQVTFSINDVTAEVSGNVGLTVTNSGSGAITLVSGRTYFTVYTNSVTGHVSDLSVASVSTGPVTSAEFTLSAIPVSLDPQVTQVIILATSDGGNQEQLYYLGSVANGTTTFLDNIPDPTLITANVYLNLDANGDEIGVSFNDPPPADLQFPIKHRGRIYGISGQKNLFFSKAESELVTESGLLVGRFEESWPPLNYLDVSEGAEEALGLLTDGQVLYIGTEQRIIRLFGDGPDTYLIPEALFEDVGILNQDVWQIVFLEGNPIGAMWLSHDFRVVGSDFNTYQDVGTPIQDVLGTINISVAQQAAWASYFTSGPHCFYMLAVPTGSNTLPDTLLVFDLKLTQWYVWKLADVATGGIFNTALSSGQLQNFFTTSSGLIYTFDPQAFLDRVGGASPTNFPITVQTSWTPMGDAAARKILNEIEVQTGDTGMLVTVEGASTTQQYATPNLVRGPSPLVPKPRGELAVFLASAVSKDRFYRMTFSTTSESLDYLRGYNVEGVVLHRV